MGTTLTAVYVGEEEVAIAHVGDSRAYCLRDGQLLRLTDDHSLVDELIRQGRLTPEEAIEHPQRSVITRALGPEGVVEVDTRSFRARSGDVYLLCSDGLTTMVDEEQIATVAARSHPLLRDAGEALIAAANEAGGRDNITVVLIRLEEVDIGDGARGRTGRDDGQHPGCLDACARDRDPVGATAGDDARRARARAAANAPAARASAGVRGARARGRQAPPAAATRGRAGVRARGARRDRLGRLPGAAVGVLRRDEQPRPGDDVRGPALPASRQPGAVQQPLRLRRERLHRSAPPDGARCSITRCARNPMPRR